MPHQIPDPFGDPEAVADGILTWFVMEGCQTILMEGETLLDHGLRTARITLEEDGTPAAVSAALLHDAGYLLLNHDRRPVGLDLSIRQLTVGANWLERSLGIEVSEPVRLHMTAKRWLLAVDRTYRSMLSDFSFRILVNLGGPLKAGERAQFERLPGSQKAIDLARRDEKALLDKSNLADPDRFRESLIATLSKIPAGQVA